MLKIEVRSATSTTRNLTSKAGKALTFIEQEAYAYTLDREGKPRPYPESCVLNLQPGQEPYPVGNYMLAPTSVWVGDYRRLNLAPKLVPIK
jgi:hypothetical protein